MNLTFNSFKNQKSLIFYFWNFSFRHSRFRQKAVTAESGFPKNGTFTSWVRKQISPTERKRLSNAGTDSKFFFFLKIRRKNNFSSIFFCWKLFFQTNFKDSANPLWSSFWSRQHSELEFKLSFEKQLIAKII